MGIRGTNEIAVAGALSEVIGATAQRRWSVTVGVSTVARPGLISIRTVTGSPALGGGIGAGGTVVDDPL
jgi:hypothetical protein